MLKDISNLGSVVTKTEQKLITGGRAMNSCNCGTQYFFCNEAHPDSYNGFAGCMDDAGCA